MLDVKLTDHDYEPKGQEFGKTLFKELSPIANIIDHIDILTMDITGNTPDLKVLQHEDEYFKCICNSLHVSSVQNKFITQDNLLYKLMQDGDNMFEALIVPKSLETAILVNSYNIQGHASKAKTYLLIKRDFFWKDICMNINTFTQLYHTYKNSHIVTFTWNLTKAPWFHPTQV